MKKKLIRVILSGLIGLLGFCIVLAADLILWMIAFEEFDFVIGTAYNPIQLFFMYLVAPAMVLLSSVVISRRFGASWIKSIITGVLCLLTVTIVGLNQENYAPFNLRETLAYQSIVILVIISSVLIVSSIEIFNKVILVALILAVILFTFIFDGSFMLAFIPWIILPMSAEIIKLWEEDKTMIIDVKSLS
jgi:hypothetical protein